MQSRDKILELACRLRGGDHPGVAQIVEEIFGDNEANDDVRLLHLIAQLKSNPRAVELESLQQSRLWHYQHPDLLRPERAFVALLLGDASEALALLHSIPDSEHTGTTRNRLGTAQLLLGNHSAALASYQQAIALEPENADHYNNLGGAFVRLQRLEEGLATYEQCLALNPKHPQALQSRLTIAAKLHQGDSLLEELNSQLAAEPNNHETRLALFHTLRRLQRGQDAVQLLSSVLEPIASLHSVDPTLIHEDRTLLAQLHYRLALADHCQEQQLWKQTQVLIDQALLLLTPPPPHLQLRRAVVLAELRAFDAAQKQLAKLEAEHPDQADAVRLGRAHLLMSQGQDAAALSELEAIAATSPLYRQSLQQRGHLLLVLGRIAESHTILLELAETNVLAFAQLIQTRNYSPDAAVLEKLQTIADNPLLPDGMRETVCFALSEALAKQKSYAKSFHYLQTANTLVDRQVADDPRMFTARVNQQIQVFTPALMQAHAPLPRSSPTPIFIVGMPRSGTTLTETILGSHPSVHPCGELPNMPAIIQGIGRNYPGLPPYPHSLSSLAREQLLAMANAYLRDLPREARSCSHSADKLPHNFMNVGLIHLLFPQAPIIHVKRDPRDTGLSNYQQNFNAKYTGMGYSFSLEKIAKQINDYHRMMGHWRALAIPMFEFWYEDLVADQEEVTRQLLSYCGLPWDASVLTFHTLERSVRTASVGQVRQAIYSSSAQKWRHYEEELEPMLNTFDSDWVCYYPGPCSATMA